MDEQTWHLLEAQHASLGRWQARECGVGRRELEALIRRDVFEVITRRVLRLRGSPCTAEQALMIRVLDAGEAAIASRRASAWVWGVPGFTPGFHDIARARDLTSRASSGRDHWPRFLPDHHITVVRGIPVTTLPRTIFDLAGMPRYAPRLGRVIDTIHSRSPSILLAVHTMLPELAKQGRNGITLMRELLAERPPDAVPRTGLERRFEELLAGAGLRIPRMQVDLGGHSWIGRVDYYDDPPISVIYEVDSVIHHTSLTDRRNDALRDEQALRAGFREVVRIFEEEIWYEPNVAIAKVRDARRRHAAS